MILITHDGRMHTDDVFSYAVLKTIFVDHRLIRTRNQDIINNDNVSQIVFDVGMKFDNEKYFDHHQKEKEVREDGTPYSSFGLVWRKFGYIYIKMTCGHDLSKDMIEDIFTHVDRNIVYYVDIGDNGHHNESTSIVMHSFSFNNIISNIMSDDIDTFIEMSNLFSRILQEYIIKRCKKIKTHNLLKSLLKDRDKTKNYIYVGDVENHDAAFFIDNKDEGLYYVMYKYSKDDTYAIQAIRKNHDSFDVIKAFPSQFGGLSEENLKRETGIDDMKFCHSGNFFCCFIF